MQKEHEIVATRLVAPIQLLISYLIVAGTGAGVVWLLGSRRPSTLALALLTGAALGLLSTVNLQRGLYVIALVLHRLARGGQVEPHSLHRVWPLGDLFDDVDAVAQRVNEQLRREQESADYREQLLRRVSAAAAQEERNRLARELHDSIKQQIFSMSLSAAAAQARWETDPAGARSAITDVQRSAHEAQVEMQALLQQLRPAALENVGLQEALRIQSEALQYRTGARVRLEEVDLPAEDLLAPGAQETIFRVVQELLSNVARHARAQNVWLRLAQGDGAMLLNVRDDGQGFDPAIPGTGTGLAGVCERAQTLGGGLEVESVPGQGTVVRVRIPLRQLSPASAHDDRSEHETDRLRDERRKSLTLGTRAAQISAILIFLAAPFAAVALATCAAIYGYVRARLYDAQLAVRSGRTDRDVAAQYREAGLLAGILGLCSVSLWFLPVAQMGWSIHLGTATITALSLLPALGGLIWCVRWYAGLNRYHAMLPPVERQAEIGRRIREIQGSIFSWSVIVLVAVFISPPSLVFPPHSLNRWSDDAAVAILTAWPLLALGDYLLAVHWRKRLSPLGT